MVRVVVADGDRERFGEALLREDVDRAEAKRAAARCLAALRRPRVNAEGGDFEREVNPVA